MGVPLLLTWLKRCFAPCFLPKSGCPETDCLYIDVNGLVYQSAALATANEAVAADVDAAILRTLFDLLDDILFSLVRPRSLVYLAVDGISPMGKLAQQRSRRRRRRHQQQRGAAEWDSNGISVGTPFMSRLTDALHFYCASRAERINAERLRSAMQRAAREEEKEEEGKETPLTPISFVVDDVWRPGEGENKIADAIRRFRSQPTYDPNTSHVICSSDTDVTVCSLILHEPRMYVLRYEYPAGRGTTNGEASGSWRNHVGDDWTSTFFSINAFREQLRCRLRLQHGARDSADEVERKSRQFERALHDVVFVLQLFGNDFLPSVGCRIEEGFLDSLLELLATDFISRNRSIVDPVTNTIQFDAARYALDSLAEMHRERGDGNGLSIDNGAEGAAEWGFADDAFLRQKQAMEETELAPQCYAYWTMLQWSLQNSAGVVEHWGCYYPYNNAPPLHLLRKYCGTLSYDALIDLAKKRNHKRRGGNAVSSHDTEVTAKVWGNGPADVLVQLLVLLPARSIALLPSAVRNAYAEIEPTVLAPVEELDFPAIEAWCEKRWAMFTEEERTRFRAYALAAGPHVLAREAQGATIQGNEMIFLADWDAEGFATEVRHAKTARSSRATEVTSEEVGTNGNGASASSSNATSVLKSSFFGMRPAHKPSAALAALITASKESKPSTCDDRNDTKNDSNGDDNGNSAAGASEVVAQEAHRPQEGAEVLCGRGFTLIAAPTGVLGDAAMIKRVGSVVGDAFVCGQYTSPPLSRHPQKMRIRLRWRVAAKPLLTSARFVPDLLPGYTAPPLVLSSHHAAKKAGVKRPTVGADDSGSDSDGGNKNGGENPSTLDVMTELEKRKEAVRRRLEALQARTGGTE